MQLTDCFTSKGGVRQTLQQARDYLQQSLSPIVATKTLSIFDAQGYVLAEDILATVDIPAFDNSAVDGYAVASDRLEGAHTELAVVGRVAAGDVRTDYDKKGAVRIFTGAPVPKGFDAIYMQEDVRLSNNHVILPAGIKFGDNIRPKGEDVKRGRYIVAAGRRLTPALIALIASQGIASVQVYEKVRVGFFSSGNELLQVGDDRNRLEKGYVFDSNRPMMLSMLRATGNIAIDLGCAKDTFGHVQNILHQASGTCDVILAAGGMSVGEEDYVQAVLKKHQLSFWQLAVKPGRPIGFGSVYDTPFLGFPGNPVSVYVGFALLGAFVIKLLGGEKGMEIPRIEVNTGFPVRKKPGRREFLRVSLKKCGNSYIALKAGAQGSGIISSLANATGLLEIPEDVIALAVGDTAYYIPFKGVFD